MKIAVTGAAGFLGRVLAHDLKSSGHEVLALVRDDADLNEFCAAGISAHAMDLSEPNRCDELFRGCQAVVHCAALTKSFGRWIDFKRINVDITKNIMESARQARVPKVIHVSTTSVYGNERNHYGTDEESDFGRRVVDPYTRSKIWADKIVLELLRSEGMPVIILRFGNLWGPGDQNTLPAIVRGLKRGRLFIEGGGDNILSLTHIENAVAALKLTLNKRDLFRGVFNITDGARITSRKFISDIISLLGIKYDLKNIPYPLLYSAGYLLEQLYIAFRRSENPPLTRFAARLLKYHAIFDISQAVSELGYRPVRTYSQCLAGATPYIRSLYYGSK
jgi:2-alkyl-3-oxoalkanoate reductase